MIHELNSFYSRSYKVLRVSKLHTSNKIATKNKEMGKPTCPAFSRSEFLCFHHMICLPIISDRMTALACDFSGRSMEIHEFCGINGPESMYPNATQYDA